VWWADLFGPELGDCHYRVEAFFTERKLPLKDELIGELTLWRTHAEQGLKFAKQCDRLMQQVMHLLESAGQHRRP
jgi:coenzyme F420-reducing hydrogenase delta subunit